MVAVAPTLDARSQLSSSVRGMQTTLANPYLRMAAT